MYNIGETLKRLRTAAKLTQQEVADWLEKKGLHMSYKGISKWEQNTTSPNAAHLIALCELYGIRNIKTAFGGTETLNALGLERLQEFESLLRLDARFIG